MKTLNKFALLVIAVVALTSCHKDNSDPTPTPKPDPIPKIPDPTPKNPEISPLTGAWIISSQNVTWGGNYEASASIANPISLSGGYSVLYSVGGRTANGYFYTLNNTNNGDRGIRRFLATTSSANPTAVDFLGTGGGLSTLQEFEVNFCIYNSTTGYYTDVLTNPGKIYTFNPTNLTAATSNWDLTSAVTTAVPAFGTAKYKHIGNKLLIRRGNTIYADVTFGNSVTIGKQVSQLSNTIYIAAIDASTGNLIAVNSADNASNIGLYNDHPLVNEDPVSHAIYFATVSDMASSPQNVPSKIFKIANGVHTITEVANYSTISGYKGEFNSLYAYNDYVYTKIDPDGDMNYFKGGHGATYRKDVWQWIVIPPGSNTKKDLDIPKDNFYAYQQPRLINGEIYFIFNNSTQSGIRKITPLSTPPSTTVPTTVVTNFTPPATPVGNIRISGIDRL